MKKYLPGPVKTLAATTAETLRWGEAETLNGSAIKSLGFVFTGTDNDVDTIVSIAVFCGGVQIFSLNEVELAQWLSVLGKRALAAGTATWFSIPLNWMDPSCALPPNQALRVEVAKDNTGGAGTLQLFYEIDETQPAACYPLYLSGSAGIAASSTSFSYPITQPGLLKGILLPDTADISLLRLYAGGTLLWDFSQSGMLLAAQDYYSAVATTSAEKFLFLDVPVPVVPGTRLEVSTAAGFAGAAARIGILTLVPNAA